MADLTIQVNAQDNASSTLEGVTGATQRLGAAANQAGSVISGMLGSALQGATAGLLDMVGASNGFVGILKTSADEAIKLADATRKLSRETGMSSESASEMIGVFDRYGVSTQQASTSLGMFEKNIRNFEDSTTKAQASSKGFAGAVNELHLSLTDAQGALLPMDTVLGQVADRFATMPDGPEKTALAMTMFGRAGKDMISTLDLGSAGIDQLKAKMDSLGLSLTGEQVAAVRQYELAHKDLEQAIQGVQVQLGMALMPAMVAVAQAAAEMATQFNQSVMPSIRQLGADIAAILPGFTDLKAFVQGAADSLNQIGQSVNDAALQLRQMAQDAYTWGANLITQFANGMIDSMQPIFDAINAIGDAIAGLMEPGSPPKFLPLIDQWGQQTAQVYMDAWMTADVDSPINAMGTSIKDGLSELDLQISAIKDKQQLDALERSIKSGKLTGDALLLAELEAQKLHVKMVDDAAKAHDLNAGGSTAGGKGGKGGGSKNAAGGVTQLAQAQEQLALQMADGAGKVALWQEAVNKATPGTVEYAHAQLELAKAQEALKKSQEQTEKTQEQQAAALSKAKMDDALASVDAAGKVKIYQDALDAAKPGSIEAINLHKDLTNAKDAAAKASQAEAQKEQTAQGQIAKAQLDAAFAAADGAGKVKLLQDARDHAKPGSVEYYDLTRRITDQEHSNASALAATEKKHDGAAAAASKHAATLGGQLASAQEKAALAGADHAGKLAILQKALDEQTPGTIGYAKALTALEQEQNKGAAASKRGAGAAAALASATEAAALAGTDHAGKLKILEAALAKTTPGTLAYEKALKALEQEQQKGVAASNAQARAADQVAAAQERAAMAGASHTEKLKLLQDAVDRAKPGTVAYYDAVAKLKEEQARGTAEAEKGADAHERYRIQADKAKGTIDSLQDAISILKEKQSHLTEADAEWWTIQSQLDPLTAALTKKVDEQTKASDALKHKTDGATDAHKAMTKASKELTDALAWGKHAADLFSTALSDETQIGVNLHNVLAKLSQEALQAIKEDFADLRVRAIAWDDSMHSIQTYLSGLFDTAVKDSTHILNDLGHMFSWIGDQIGNAIDAVKHFASAVSSIHMPSISLPHIPGFAEGVQNFRGGLALVGEHGPELVHLPRGSTVLTNSQTRNAMPNQQSGMNTGGQTTHTWNISITGVDTRDSQAIVSRFQLMTGFGGN